MTKKVEYKTKEQRKEDVRNIIKELNNFELTLRYEPVKKLYAHFKDFIENGNIVKVNIPFPMINRRIKGNLMPNVKADSAITLIKERFN
jgi:hypothetical protein